LICNHQVVSSNLTGGSIWWYYYSYGKF